jgi:beta-glucosidase
LTPETTGVAQPIHVSFTLKNAGGRTGIEVAQVYVGLPPTMAPPKRLAGWARVQLEPGEQRRVTVTLDPHSPDHPLSTWDAETQAWEMVHGDCRIFVGASSRDIRLADRLLVG